MKLTFDQAQPKFVTTNPLKTFNDIDKVLIEADQTLLNGRRHAGIITQAHMAIIMNFNSINFQFIERRYRELASDTYLLGAPLDQLPDGVKPINIITRKKTKYWLWCCVNGYAEAISMMQQFGIKDHEDNLGRLAVTGVLTKT